MCRMGEKAKEEQEVKVEELISQGSKQERLKI